MKKARSASVDQEIVTGDGGTTLSLRATREAVRSRTMSFPSQVPAFRNLHRPDLQWRMALLYFVRGWTRERIATRYALTPRRVAQLLQRWTERAMQLGYMHELPAEQARLVAPSQL